MAVFPTLLLVFSLLAYVATQQRAQQRLLEQIMVDLTNVRAVIDAMNETTNGMAADIDSVVLADAVEDAAFQKQIDDLKAQLAAGDAVTQAQLDALAVDLGTPNAKLVELRDKLKALAADPSNPIPPVA